MDAPANSEKQIRISSQVSGPVKQLIKTDYHALRNAGLTRHQALSICIRRYLHSK
jgi:hypothetical protein